MKMHRWALPQCRGPKAPASGSVRKLSPHAQRLGVGQSFAALDRVLNHFGIVMINRNDPLRKVIPSLNQGTSSTR